jgi:hypothetical protein
LNAGLWFRRGRLAMVFSSLAASCCCCAENPLIPAVQISGTTSENRRLKRMYADLSMQADLLKEALGKK